MDWVCSGCGRHYSWMVTECPYCQPVETITTGGTQPITSNSAMVPCKLWPNPKKGCCPAGRMECYKYSACQVYCTSSAIS